MGSICRAASTRCSLYDRFNGAEDSAAQRQASIGEGPLFQVRTHGSENVEAGGNMHFVLITETEKFPFRQDAARSRCAGSRGLTLVGCGDRSEDRAGYFEQQSVVFPRMANDNGKLDKSKMLCDAWPNYM